MVDYGEHNIDEAPTSTHVHRVERKYSLHKLAKVVGQIRFQRSHRGDSARRK